MAKKSTSAETSAKPKAPAKAKTTTVKESGLDLLKKARTYFEKKDSDVNAETIQYINKAIRTQERA